MRSDYEAIREQNILDYGQKTSHLDLFRQLYADRTHFIYELLQNAEDAGASRLRFAVHQDRLEVNHNGRAFTHDDVRAICGVGVGTKRNELTQIGRFGIGFKSVFAYTDTPHVYSRRERFLIRDFVRPEKTPKRTDAANDTLFVFPFDRNSPSAEVSRAEVESGLHRLHGDVLLFLRSLRRISVEIDDEHVVQLERNRRKSTVSLLTQNSDGVGREKWRVFGAGTAGNPEDPLVEIAFLLDDAGLVIRDPRPQLSAYFPTDKETGLRFRVQGPYRTTPARDNVPDDDPWNRRLVKATAELAASALAQFCEDRQFGLDVLRVMPLDEDDTPEESMFHPVYRAVLTVMRREPLIPVEDGGFTKADAARLGRASALRALLDAGQLAELAGSKEDLLWVDGRITAESEPRIHWYLTNDLEIAELTPRGVVVNMKRRWLKRQSTEWMIKFYQFLSDQRALWARWTDPLRSSKFVRLEDGRHVRPDKAYLPPSEESAFPVVDREIAADEKALDFLKALGLKQPDAVDDLILRVVDKYGSKKGQPSVDELNADDLETIRAMLRAGSEPQRARLLTSIRGRPIFRAWNDVGGRAEYRSASQVLARNAVTQMWFEGSDDVWWLDDAYQLTSEELQAFGIRSRISVRRRTEDFNGCVTIEFSHGWHRRGLAGFNPRAAIDGLDHALTHINVERARFLWNEILGRDPVLISGEVETATRQDYSNGNIEVMVSEIGEKLRSAPWLPIEGGFSLTVDLSIDDLPEGFERNYGAAERLGMRSTTVDDLARLHGMVPDDLQWILDHPDELAKLRADAEVDHPPSTESVDPVHDAGDSDDEVHHVEANDDATEHGRADWRIADRAAGAAESNRSERTGSVAAGSPFEDGTGGTPAERSEANKDATTADQKSSIGQRHGPRVTYLAANESTPVGSDVGEARRRIERIGIDTVMSIELGKGREPEEMPRNNPGYDIVSKDGDDVRYIEVKALRDSWGESGVALTATEYGHAVEHGAAYWLYVVERCDAERRVTMIRNPGEKPTQYVYDSGWRDLPEEERLQP